MFLNDQKFTERRKELRRNQTESEKLLWKVLRNRQLGNSKFFRQYGVGSYILDFCCPEKKLVIELDGGQHAEEDNQKYDNERTEFLEALGYRVIRFWNSNVLKNLEGVVEEIRQALTPPAPLFKRGVSDVGPPPLEKGE